MHARVDFMLERVGFFRAGFACGGRVCAGRARVGGPFTVGAGAKRDAGVEQLARGEPLQPLAPARVLVSWSHPGRLRSEAAFARLAGAAPIPASSGKTMRHRLDRGGDRQLNRALHTILLTRRRQDPATRAYINRRLSEGKTEREAIRCLKRYLARSLYRQLERESRTT